MRISDWSSDVCSSDLKPSSWKGAPSPFGSSAHPANDVQEADKAAFLYSCKHRCRSGSQRCKYSHMRQLRPANIDLESRIAVADDIDCPRTPAILPKSKPELRSEEHTSELQSLMRISYAVFCLKKKNRELTE